MTYFNGGIHGRNTGNGYIPPEPTTAVYCDTCAETVIPLPGDANTFGRHFDTGFRWAPVYGGGRKCDACEVAV